MTEMKKTIINYLNNLVVEAAKTEAGDYSSLNNNRLILPFELKNARSKVLQGEYQNYSEKILNEIDSKEQIEKKRAQVVNATHGYVFLQKNNSVQPDEAQEIMKNFAELLKEEIVSEARELGKTISFADLPSECQSKLGVRSWTNTRSLIDGKSYILEFIRSNNNIGESSQIKEKETDSGSADNERKTEPSTDEEKVDWLKEQINNLKISLLGSKSLRNLLISSLETGGWESYWAVYWGEENIYVLDFIEREIENEVPSAEAKAFFEEIGGKALEEVKEILERERSPNDYETDLAKFRVELANIAERIGRATAFNEAVENDFQQLDELIIKIGERYDFSAIGELFTSTENSELRRVLLLAPEYYIQKVEAKMQELGHSDEKVNSLIHYHGIEEELDWKGDIRRRTDDSFTALKKHVNEDLLSWIETLPAKKVSKSPWSKSEKAGAIAIVVLVVGVGGIVLGKWVQGWKGLKETEKRTLKLRKQKK